VLPVFAVGCGWSSRHRRRRRQVFFGQNAMHLSAGGSLRVGDTVRVLERQAWAQSVTWS
jgi:uncharacterized protein YcbX